MNKTISLLINIVSFYGIFYIINKVVKLMMDNGNWWILPTTFLTITILLIFNIGVWLD